MPVIEDAKFTTWNILLNDRVNGRTRERTFQGVRRPDDDHAGTPLSLIWFENNGEAKCLVSHELAGLADLLIDIRRAVDQSCSRHVVTSAFQSLQNGELGFADEPARHDTWVRGREK